MSFCPPLPSQTADLESEPAAARLQRATPEHRLRAAGSLNKVALFFVASETASDRRQLGGALCKTGNEGETTGLQPRNTPPPPRHIKYTSGAAKPMLFTRHVHQLI